MKALIIIDMLNGFCRMGNPLSLPIPTSDIEQYIISMSDHAIKNGDKLIFICDSHLPTDPEIGKPYPLHCVKGTHESLIIETLKPYLENAIVLNKNTLSVFLNTGLENLLKEIQPEEIEVTGVCTDICILFAVYELRVRGYNVFVSHKGVLPLDLTKQEEFLEYFENRLGARIEK